MKSSSLGYGVATLVGAAFAIAACAAETSPPTGTESAALASVTFTQIYGMCATSFAAGPNDTMLITQCPTATTPGPNFPVAYYSHGAWQTSVAQGAAGVQVAMSPAGTPWVITDRTQDNQNNNIYKLDIVNNTQTRMNNACATSIAVGPNELPVITSCALNTQNNYLVEYYTGRNASGADVWGNDPAGGAGLQVAVSPEGVQWVLSTPAAGNGYNNIYEKVGGDGTPTTGTWKQISPGCASSIGVGPGNTPWITGCDGFANGAFTKSNHMLYELSSGSWVAANTAGRGWDVSVSPDTGLPWVLSVANASNSYWNIYDVACVPTKCTANQCTLQSSNGCGGTQACTAGCCKAPEVSCLTPLEEMGCKIPSASTCTALP